MKKVIMFLVTVCIFVSSGECFAENWKYAVTSMGGDKYYVDMDSVYEQKLPFGASDIFFYVKITYGSDGKRKMSKKYGEPIACAIERWAVSFREYFVTIVSYKIYNTSGKVVSKSSRELDYNNYEEIKENTIADKVADLVWKTKFLPRLQ
ncbi:MAG: hypothetical protein Q4E17_00385 [Synergistes sp.]|nr:hypothetical protein [Synergistes sp.]